MCIRDRLREESPDGRARLIREARAMAKLRHPCVLAVHDAITLDDQIAIVMELVDGEDLAAYFGKRPPWRDVLARCREAGRGLHAAHAAGLVHRDFKPH